ncbi:MAG: PilZ domain-containing protein [Mariprofundus sp.]
MADSIHASLALMDNGEQDIIKQMSLLAEQLPEDKSKQLLDLIADWREDVRRSPRELYSEHLSVTSEHGTYHGCAHDISATGLFFESVAGFSLGEHISLELIFISAPNPVKLKGEVVRIDDNGVAIVFDQCFPDQLAKLETIISQHALIMHPPGRRI